LVKNCSRPPPKLTHPLRDFVPFALWLRRPVEDRREAKGTGRNSSDGIRKTKTTSFFEPVRKHEEIIGCYTPLMRVEGQGKAVSA
jgi:hypothetical protein